MCLFDDKNLHRLGVRKDPLVSLCVLPFSACKISLQQAFSGRGRPDSLKLLAFSKWKWFITVEQKEKL